jgi:recombination protein RecR
MRYTKPLEDLIEEFRKFPTIGPKSAQRMAFALLKRSPEQVEKFARILCDAKEHIKYCNRCFNLTNSAICEICEDPRRDSKLICVVESVKDLIALERTHEYRGLYHVLGGVISPLDGISADDLNLGQLTTRLRLELDELQEDGGLEIVLAISLSTEGEATMLYLKRLISQLGDVRIKLTRLAHGLPVGADLDYADETTLARAFQARVVA